MPPTTRKDPRKAKGGAIDEKTEPSLQQDHLVEDSFGDEETICPKRTARTTLLSLRPTMGWSTRLFKTRPRPHATTNTRRHPNQKEAPVALPEGFDVTENMLDNLKQDLTNYVSKLLSAQLSPSDGEYLSGSLKSISDLERVGAMRRTSSGSGKPFRRTGSGSLNRRSTRSASSPTSSASSSGRSWRPTTKRRGAGLRGGRHTAHHLRPGGADDGKPREAHQRGALHAHSWHELPLS